MAAESQDLVVRIVPSPSSSSPGGGGLMWRRKETLPFIDFREGERRRVLHRCLAPTEKTKANGRIGQSFMESLLFSFGNPSSIAT